MSKFYTHNDGLTQHYGTRTTNEQPVSREAGLGGLVKEIVVDFDYTQIGSTAANGWFTEDSGGGSTPDSPSGIHAAIPNGDLIESATLIVKTAFASGGAATLDLGTYLSDGTAIDANGIDAAIAVASLTAGAVINCDGAQIGAVLSNGPAFIAGNYGTAAFTAGEARLIIKYVSQRA